MKVRSTFVGLAVLGLGVALLTSIDWNAAGQDRHKRDPVTGQRAGTDEYVEVNASWAAGDWAGSPPTALINAPTMPATPQVIDAAHGWTFLNDAHSIASRQYGPFRVGDPFKIIVSAGFGHVRCSVRTVGLRQNPNPPATVSGEHGEAICTITVGTD